MSDRKIRRRRTNRRLFVESLEARRVLDGGAYLEPPPASYLSNNEAVEVSRLTWEFYEWEHSEVAHGSDFWSQDKRVLIENNRALLAMSPTAGNMDSLRSELAAIGSMPDAVLERSLSAWVPLASLKELPHIQDLLFCSFEAVNVTTVGSNGPVAAPSNDSVTLDSTSIVVGASPIGWSANIDVPLRSLWESRYAPSLPLRMSPSTEELYAIDGDRVLVNAVGATVKGSVLSKQLHKFGAEVTAITDIGVSAWIPISEIPKLGNVPELTVASVEMYPMVYSGNAMTQGDAQLKADLARSKFNATGQGQAIGVISDSFNRQGGAASDVSSNELSTVNVVAENNGSSGTTDEGRAMLQIVHDVAPSASLLFATGYISQQSFANNITSLYNAGARIIVDDLLYFAEPMFMDGPIANAVETVTSQGVTYVSAAGNYGNKSYESKGFVASTVTRDYGRGKFGRHD